MDNGQAAPASALAVISRSDGGAPTRHEAKALQIGRRPLYWYLHRR